MSIYVPFFRFCVCLVVMTFGTAVYADQFLTASDNATLSGAVSKSDVTRISFTGDAALSLQKIKPANPSDDFSVTHDGSTGDIYVTLPVLYNSKFINFFATSRRGFTYKFVLAVKDIPATQIFVQNPAIGSERAGAFEREQPYRHILVKLIRAMWNRQALLGYTVEWRDSYKVKAGPVTYHRIGRYEGGSFEGHIYEVRNRTKKPITLSESIFETARTLAVSMRQSILPAKASTTVYVVISRQEGDHDGAK